MQREGKFDPRIKETPDLPGEIYDDHFFCAWCHEEIGLSQLSFTRTIDDDQPCCEDCAAQLDAMWDISNDSRMEDDDYRNEE